MSTSAHDDAGRRTFQPKGLLLPASFTFTTVFATKVSKHRDELDGVDVPSYLQRMLALEGSQLAASCCGISRHSGTRFGTTFSTGGQFRHRGKGKQTDVFLLSVCYFLQIVVDCRGHLLGRLASVLAKEFLIRVQVWFLLVSCSSRHYDGYDLFNLSQFCHPGALEWTARCLRVSRLHFKVERSLGD